MTSSRNIFGVVLALIGGIGWGFSGTCAQFLFATSDTEPLWATAVSMLVAGGVLMAVALVNRRSELKGLWTSPRSVARLVLFALCGLLFVRVTYLLAVLNSNAGTATVLQYIGPVLIVFYTCALAHRAPAPREVLAMVLVVVGTFLLATHGDPTSMVLSPAGLLWGLISAVAAALYTLLPGPLMERHGSSVVVASGIFVGGLALSIATAAWGNVPTLDGAGLLAFFGGFILIGTIVGFSAYLRAVKEIGAAKASLLASVETVSATVCAAVWLGTPFAALDLLGFAFIMATVFILAKKGSTGSAVISSAACVPAASDVAVDADADCTASRVVSAGPSAGDSPTCGE